MRAITVIAILVVAVISAYGETRHHGFVDFDDPLYVTGCAEVQRGLTVDGVRWAFVSLDAMNWHPLTWLSHMVDVEMFQLNAGMHHVVNVGLHAINAALALACMFAVSRSFWPSAAIALVWSVHPLRVESAAWIAERKDLLSAMFGLLCIIAHVWYAARPSLGRWTAPFLMLTLGLMAKPMLVTWPCLLLLLDVWPLRRWPGSARGGLQDAGIAGNPKRSFASLVIEKLPMLAMVALSSALTVRAQHSGGALRDTAEVGLWSRFANALVAYAAYVGDLFWPHDLAVLYPLPHSQPVMLVAASAGLTAAITLLALFVRRRVPLALVGWLWYLGTLVPVIGLVQVGTQFKADRYTYLPHLGLLLALCMSVQALARGRTWPVIALAIAASIPLWLATRAQVRVWRDSTTLCAHALAVTSGNWMLHINMGAQAFQRGDAAAAQHHFQESLRINARNPIAHANLGEMYMHGNQTSQALEHLEESIRLYPHGLTARANLAWLLTTASNPMRHDIPRALQIAREVCDDADPRSPYYPIYLDVLGAAYAASGRFDEASTHATRALEFADADRHAAIRERIQRHLALYAERRAPQ